MQRRSSLFFCILLFVCLTLFLSFSILDTVNATVASLPVGARRGDAAAADAPSSTLYRSERYDRGTSAPIGNPYLPLRRVSLVLAPSFDSFSSLRFRSLFYLKCFLLRHPSIVPDISVVHLGRNGRNGDKGGIGWWGDVLRWGTGTIPTGAVGSDVTYLVVGATDDSAAVTEMVRNATQFEEGVSVGTVVLGDEKETAQLPPGADFIVKNYQSVNHSLSFTWLQCAGVATSCTNVPLTFPLTFECPDRCEPQKMLKASKRRIEWNFMGSLRRNRAKIVASLTPQVTDPDRQVIRVTSNFNHGSRADYEATLDESVFTVTPCGNNAETIRFWEALARGSIPLVEDCRTASGAQRRFQRALTAARFPLSFYQDFDNISSIFESFDGKLDEVQGALLTWLREWEGGIKHEVVRRVVG